MDVAVGTIAKPHGLDGELAVDVRTDSPDARFATGSVLRLRPPGQAPAWSRALTVRRARAHGRRWLVRFHEVASREAAEELAGCVLLVDAAELASSDDPDEFHDHELIGLAAQRLDGQEAGTVRDVTHGPAGDLLVLDCAGREVLVPFVRAIAVTVDLSAGRIVLDPPGGLLDDTGR